MDYSPYHPDLIRTPPGGAMMELSIILNTETEEEEDQNSQYISITVVCTHTEPPDDLKKKGVLSLGRAYTP